MIIDRNAHARQVTDKHIGALMTVHAALFAVAADEEAPAYLRADLTSINLTIGSMIMTLAQVQTVRQLVAVAEEFADFVWGKSETLHLLAESVRKLGYTQHADSVQAMAILIADA